jgi:hypothetical protein
VTHPQIAAFARVAKENDPPVRALEGHKTLLSRTMHGMGFDPIHDEIVVNSPLAQAILVFRGAADGEEAPIRVIQGPKTRILGVGYGALSTVTPDPHNNEIFIPIGSGGYRERGNGGPEGILVFDRLANGDVPPKRFISGPDTLITGANSQVGIDHIRSQSRRQRQTFARYTRTEFHGGRRPDHDLSRKGLDHHRNTERRLRGLARQ